MWNMLARGFWVILSEKDRFTAFVQDICPALYKTALTPRVLVILFDRMFK